jgi:hypothetical protein
MPGRQRHPDGTQRRKHRPTRLTDGYLIARWLEREVLRQKKLGVAYAAIADLITRAARGEQGTGVVLPDPDIVVLPPDYSITAMSCCRAVRRALNREPAQAAEEYRNLDTARLEDWLLALASGVRKGDALAIRTSLELIKHKADLNGYGPSKKSEVAMLNQTLIFQQINELVDDASSTRAIEARLSRAVGRQVTIDEAIKALRSVEDAQLNRATPHA